MDALVTAVRELFAFVTGVKPKFKVHGGTNAENLALQNIQVRGRHDQSSPR
jgi:NAD+ synthase (glutamine-hydrolysing)